MVRCLGFSSTRTSCSVTRASRVFPVCVSAQERTTAKPSSGGIKHMGVQRHRRHTQPTIPTPLPCPPLLAFSLPAGASPSQSALSLFLSLCASAFLCPLPTSVSHGVACVVGGFPTSSVIECVFGRKGVRGRGGEGAGAVSCLPASPALGLHPLHVGLPTAVSCGALHWVRVVCGNPLGQ